MALALKKLKQKFIIIELNNFTELENEKEKFEFIVGDSTNLEILEKAGILKAKVAIVTLPKEADVGEVIRVSKAVNPGIQLIIRKHHESINFDQGDVFAIVEPEFEATLKMLEKLLVILQKKDKSIIHWVREQKKLLS
jgi:voltage-gated potassium channel Kch